MEKLGEKIMLCKNCKTLIIQCKIIKGIRLFLDLDENHQLIPSNVAQYSMDNGMFISHELDYQSFKKTIEHKTVVSMCQ